MIKEIRSKKGITIVELLVSLTLTVIILTALVYLFASALKLYSVASDNYSAHTMALFTMQKIEDEVSYADSMQIDNIEPVTFFGKNDECLYVENGRLAESIPNGTGGLKDKFIYLSGAFTGLNCSTTFNLTSPNDVMVLNVKISVYMGNNTSNVLYTTQTNIVINNLDPILENGQIVDTTNAVGGSAIEFHVPSLSN